MIVIFSIFCLFSTAESHVSFTKSEIIEGQDVVNSRSMNIRCSKGCIVYTPSDRNDILITKNDGRVDQNVTSLSDILKMSTLPYLSGYTLPADSTYKVKNIGFEASPNFIIYVVEKDAEHYGDLIVLADSSNQQFSTTQGKLTIMTSGNGIRLQNFNSKDEIKPKVYATGYDAVYENCWPIYSANSNNQAEQSQIDIHGPIATIDYETMTSCSVMISGNVLNPSSENSNSFALSSPGYVGCKLNSNDLYWSTEQFIDNTFTNDMNGNINIHFRLDENLPNYNEPLSVTGLTQDTLEFRGVEQWTGKDYSVNKVNVRMQFNRNSLYSSFAYQLDASKNSTTRLSLIFIILVAIYFLF